mmetsp:Transcript_130628/g.377839  ORF Transcript_130628/g.377839 Transcript_130628/m.377839 type:complete len:260 (-) Transcript_130628:424-1203(-)
MKSKRPNCRSRSIEHIPIFPAAGGGVDGACSRATAAPSPSPCAWSESPGGDSSGSSVLSVSQPAASSASLWPVSAVGVEGSTSIFVGLQPPSSKRLYFAERRPRLRRLPPLAWGREASSSAPSAEGAPTPARSTSPPASSHEAPAACLASSMRGRTRLYNGSKLVSCRAPQITSGKRNGLLHRSAPPPPAGARQSLPQGYARKPAMAGPVMRPNCHCAVTTLIARCCSPWGTMSGSKPFTKAMIGFTRPVRIRSATAAA